MTTITTRLATTADATTVHALTQAAFDTLRGKIHPPSSAHLETVEAVTAALAFGGGIAEIAGEPVGSVRFTPVDDHLYIGRVAVHPEHRGLGVARAMMAFAEVQAARAGLPETRVEVRKALTDNVAMFERLGYRVLAETPHPRQPEVGVLLLTKPISSETDGESIDG